MNVAIRRLSTAAPDFSDRLDALLAYESEVDGAVQQQVRAIIDDIRARGDAALLEYTNRFDRRSVAAGAQLEIGQAELRRARDALTDDLRRALEAAAARIRAYHERQRQETWTYTEADGTVLGQKITPLARAGVYVPGGRAAYPSSVLMNIIPARVAGVGEIVMVVPAPDGQLEPVVLA
ncbi:MAG: histidinol dehydrogenase, partial [Gammaproteobacteria bacterium]|nr:histidinol dehydrogenase [Gammaproteobacteria bacterium]